jgi:hypothetical protein
MTSTLFVALCFMTWRISSLLAEERGPYAVFEKLRSFVGVKYSATSEPYADRGFAEGLLCMWCNSVWVGGGVTLLSYLVGLTPYGYLLILPLALSTGVIVLQRWMEG